MQHHEIHVKISIELHQYLPCYVFFFRDCIVFCYFPTQPNALNFHHFTQQFSPVVVVQQIPRRGRRKLRGPPQQTHLPPAMEAPSRAWGQKTGLLATKCSVSRAMGEVSQKNTPLVLDEKVCTYSCISFKEDYVKIVWIQGGLCQDSMKKPIWIAKMPQISQAYIANPRPQGQVLMSCLKRPVHSSNRKKIKLTNAPLDYHQSSCQDSIWFIIIYNLNNYIKIHYSIDSYCECTLSRIYLWMCNHYPMSNWHWNILQKSDVNSHESLPQWAPKKCCYPWNSVYVISKYVKVHV